MNRSVHNRGSKAIEQASFFWRVGRAGLTAFLWFLLVLAFFTGLAALSHAQRVDLAGIPGPTIAAKVNWVQNDSTASYCITGGVCQLYAGPELANIPTGTLPTMASGVYLLDARSASSGLRLAATGTSALSNFGTAFTGGAVTSPIAGVVDASCAAGHPFYSFTGATDSGFTSRGAGTADICASGNVIATFGYSGGGYLILPATTYLSNGLDAVIVREASGLMGIRQTAATALAKFGGMTNCAGNAATVGVICYDATLNRWVCSENNSALSACFNGEQWLNKQDLIGAQNGTGADLTVYTYTMPANTLAAGECVEILGWIQRTVGAGAPLFKISFGATAVVSVTPVGTNNVTVLKATVCNNAGSTTAQWAVGEDYEGSGAAFATLNTTPAEATTGAIVIKMTFNVAAGTSMNGRGWLVKRKHA
jgi:hypothetical protein